jgi:hypothetical protein
VFATFLDRFGSIFSKSFQVIYLPLLLFLLAHGTTAYFFSTNFQVWFNSHLAAELDHPALATAALFIALAIVAIVFSTLSTTLRDFLEGRYLPALLGEPMTQRHRDRLARVESQLNFFRAQSRRLAAEGVAWRATLSAARKEGVKAPACGYTGCSELGSLVQLREAGQPLPFDSLKSVVEKISLELKAHNPELPGDEASKRLDTDLIALTRLIQYAIEYLDLQVSKNVDEIQFRFAGTQLAPTRMGIIANVPKHYANSRYSINLEFFWGRLQKIAAADAAFYADLQDAKSQVDLLVYLIWHTAAYSVFWSIYFVLAGGVWMMFLVASVIAPLLALLWYVIALRSYSALSVLMCSTVDLFRRGLLSTMEMPISVSIDEERNLWLSLEQRLIYGDLTNIRLKPK